MSDTMHIDGSDKKLSKSEAIRQALTTLGDNAPAIDVQKMAEQTYGGEIEMRTVYQIRSNIKTGRDATTKEKKATRQKVEKAPKAEKTTVSVKPVKTKTPRSTANVRGADEQEAFGNFDKLVQLLALVKQFGGSKKVVELLEKIAV